MTKLVIFDLDGTLLNTISDLGEACNYALQTNGFPSHQLSEYPAMVGNGVNNLILRSLPPESRSMEEVMHIKPDFIHYYNTHNRIHTSPYLGIVDVLKQLKLWNIRLAVASNKYNEATQALIRYYYGDDMFDVILGERLGVERKPNPQIIYDIFATPSIKGCTPEETLYVGDSDVDMQTAHNARLTAIGCTWGFCTRENLLDNHPDFIAEQSSDILSFIQK